MHISEAETKKRLNRQDNLVVILKQKNGRPFGMAPRGPTIPRELRSLAQATPGSNRDLAVMLNCRADTVAKIKEEPSDGGIASDDVTLKDELQAVMTHARGTALDKLNAALEHITTDKLDGAKLRELSGVAKDMSGIARDMMPETKDTGLKVVIYNTPERERDDYEIIELGADKVKIHEGKV